MDNVTIKDFQENSYSATVDEEEVRFGMIGDSAYVVYLISDEGFVKRNVKTDKELQDFLNQQNLLSCEDSDIDVCYPLTEEDLADYDIKEVGDNKSAVQTMID